MNGLNLAEVVVVTLASGTGCIIAFAQFIKRLKLRWISEAKQTQTLQANTSAVQDLTRAVSGLSARMDRVESKLDIREDM